MIPLRLSEIAALVEAEIVGDTRVLAFDPVITSVEFDTRRLRPGGMFVALPGSRVDGHDLAEQAAAAGAVAVLGSRSIAGTLPLLRTHDPDATLAALARLAHHSVTALTDPARGPERLVVVGVTGSSGKTSTKDLIAAVLRAGVADPGLVVAPPESFNNELGHPYTVLRADMDTRFLVLELSARGPGHIAALARIAPPAIGAVLNVGSAHLGEFGSVEGIAAAKGELVEALPAAAPAPGPALGAGPLPGGVAVLNADDPRVLAMAARTRARVVTVGVSPGADVRAVDVHLDPATRASFSLVTPAGTAAVRLRVAGAHQVGNALSAAAVGLAAGLDPATVAAALSTAEPASRWRMEMTDRPDGVTVINDAYNANPDSLRAALQSLATLGQGPPARRTWAVLGEMAELGAASRDAHDAIGRLVVRLNIGQLIVVGERNDGARALHLGAHLEGSWDGESELVPNVDAAVDRIAPALRPGDVVLVKASRSAGLERVAAALLAGSPPPEPTGNAPSSKDEDVAADPVAPSATKGGLTG